jgi:type II secretory pathway pseudopilin PulG
MCHFRSLKPKTQNSKLKTAFSLVETVTALIILAIVTSSVLVVISRCVGSAADSVIRRQAFEVARDNMEALLTSSTVSETTDMGTSDKYPEIQWHTTVEPFYEPVTDRMWIQAVCSAEYTDTAGKLQTVKLTHWLTDLTKEQLLQMLQQRYEQLAEDQLLKTIEEAARYVDVDVETIKQWVQNGMYTTKEGYYIKGYLELYKKYSGNPPPEAISQVQKEIAKQIPQPSGSENRGPSPTDEKKAEAKPSESQQPQESQSPPSEKDVNTTPLESPVVSRCDGMWICGKCYPSDTLNSMAFSELWKLLNSNCE